MADVINLQNLHGEQFQIAFDSCYDSKHRPKAKLDPSMMVIPCERAEIYAFDNEKLAVEVLGRPITAKRLSELNCCQLYQDCDNEKSFIFPVNVFDEVAVIVKPRKRRRLSEEQRQICAERLANVRPINPTSARSRDSVTPFEAAG